MSILPGMISSAKAAAIEPHTPREALRAHRLILLAGTDALALRPEVECHPRLISETRYVNEVAAVGTILEAILMGADQSIIEVPLILVGVSQELEQLEPAVRSLRQVYTKSPIVLLCDPSDEVLCRKAKAWGTTDYLILPLDANCLDRLLHRHLAIPPSGTQPFTESANGIGVSTELSRLLPARTTNGHAADKTPIRALAQNGHANHKSSDFTLPGLPLMVQTTLLNDLMSGNPDFMDRVIATLQSYVKWDGSLDFIPPSVQNENASTAAANTQTRGETRMPITVPGQPSFGTLVLTRNHPTDTTTTPAEAALSQAAHWLGTLLSVARRYEQLRTMAVTDELSGAYNRRYFNKFVTGLLERARLNRFRVTLLLFDIDNFKQYNDRFGHASGDAIIRELIKLLRACTRPDDLVARLGGDEFAVVYWDNEAPRQPNSEHPRDMLLATERFRKAIKAHQWPQTCNIQGEISISGGLATFPWDADSLEQLMARADEALLRAKAAGKNVILLHGCEPSEMPSETPLPANSPV